MAPPLGARFPKPRLLIKRPFAVPQGSWGLGWWPPILAQSQAVPVWWDFTLVRSEFLVLFLEIHHSNANEIKNRIYALQNHAVFQVSRHPSSSRAHTHFFFYACDHSTNMVFILLSRQPLSFFRF